MDPETECCSLEPTNIADKREHPLSYSPKIALMISSLNLVLNQAKTTTQQYIVIRLFKKLHNFFYEKAKQV